jgi:hypothetical protein
LSLFDAVDAEGEDAIDAAWLGDARRELAKRKKRASTARDGNATVPNSTPKKRKRSSEDWDYVVGDDDDEDDDEDDGDGDAQPKRRKLTSGRKEERIRRVRSSSDDDDDDGIVIEEEDAAIKTATDSSGSDDSSSSELSRNYSSGCHRKTRPPHWGPEWTELEDQILIHGLKRVHGNYRWRRILDWCSGVTSIFMDNDRKPYQIKARRRVLGQRRKDAGKANPSWW